MTDMLTTWANSFRGNSRPKTIAAEQALENELNQLRKEIEECRNYEELEAELVKLKDEVRRMEEEKADLEKRIEAAKEKLKEKRRLDTESVLKEIESIMAAHQSQLDMETFEMACPFLERLCNTKEVSPEELRGVLEDNSQEIIKVRSELERSLSDAHSEVSRLREHVDKASSLGKEAEMLKGQISTLKKDLIDSHAVDPSVIEALEQLSPKDAKRFREEFLETKRHSAELEAKWRLPRNVLAVVSKGGA